MQIEYVTHSSVRISTDRFSFLTDPFFFFDEPIRQTFCHFPPRDFTAADFGTLDYVHSSHIHPDHGDPATLELLRGQIRTAVLPAERLDLEKRYRDAGIERILLLEHSRPRQLQEGLRVCCYWSDPIDTVLVLEVDGTVVLLQNDCELDLYVVQQIAKDFPRIDYAFLRYTAAQSLYPLLLDLPAERLTEMAASREDHFIDHQALSIGFWKPRVIIPYAMTMTYFQPEQRQLNGHGRMTPPIFGRRLREFYGCESELCVLQPGDRIDVASGSIRRLAPENLWGDDLDGFLSNCEAYCARHRQALPAFDHGDLQAVGERLQRHFGSLFAAGPLPDVLAGSIGLRVVGKSSEDLYVLDLAQRAWRLHDLRASAAPACAVDITMPASIAQILLESTQLDAYTVLFLYRIHFRWNGSDRLPPEQEILADVHMLEALFGSSRSWVD